MYKFLFSFFYNYYKKKSDSEPVFTASLVVLMALAFHIILILSLVKYFFGYSIDSSIKSLNQRIIGIIIISILGILFNLYFKKRKDRIILEYNGKSRNKVYDFLKMILILIFPLIMCIILGNINSGRW